MNESTKKIGKASLALLIISTIWSFVGSILMFLDEYGYYKNVPYTYTSRGYVYEGYRHEWVSHSNPEAGIMPFFGFLLILVATILIGVSLKKNYKLAIGTIVLSFIALVLLISSRVVLEADSDESWAGYFCCCIPSGCLVFIPFILSIVYVAHRKKQENIDNGIYPKQNNNNMQSKQVVRDITKELLTLKELFDCGALTEEEFKAEKAKILKS